MGNFGIFKGFSDKLFEGELPTQLGTIGSIIFGYDTDAQAFFNRVTTAGGTLSALEKDAINKLVLDMKSYSIWSKMKAIYPMVGASSAACSQNLKSSSFTGTFSSGWTYASTGVNGNGSSAYFDTTLSPSTSLTQNSTSVSYYIGDNYINNQDIICTGSAGSFLGSYNTGAMEVAVNDVFSGAITPTVKKGLFTFSRIISTQSKIYANNLQTFTTTLASATPNIYSIKIGCFDSAGSRSRYATNSIRFAHLGDGLTDTEASNLYTAVQAFQTTLSRQV